MLLLRAMSAIRLPVLCAFAGGCLSGAVLLGFWKAGTGTGVTEPARVAPSRSAKLSLSGNPRAGAEDEPGPVSDPSRKRRAMREESANVDAADRNLDSASDPSAVKGPQDQGAVVPIQAGTPVSDVLTHLEAAYRERLVAAAPTGASSERPSTAPPANAALAPVEPAPPVAQQTPAPVVTAATPVAAVVPNSAPAAPALVATNLPPPTASTAAIPPVMAANDSRPPDVHIGDINQNTYITNVRQGDVYLMQLQMQQLAMLEYMQLLGMSSYAGLANPGPRARGLAPQRAPFPSTLTNPDNPWGFNFAPPNLVH